MFIVFFSFFWFPLFIFLFFIFYGLTHHPPPAIRHPLPATLLAAIRHPSPVTRHPRKSPAVTAWVDFVTFIVLSYILIFFCVTCYQ